MSRKEGLKSHGKPNVGAWPLARRTGLLLGLMIAAPGALPGQGWNGCGGLCTTSGNVGIGTTSPSSALTVAGGTFITATVNNANGVRQDFIQNALAGVSTNFFIGFDNWVSTTTDYSNTSTVWGTENVLRIGFAGGTGGGTVSNSVAQNNVIQVNAGSTVSSARGLDISIGNAGGIITEGKGINISQVDGTTNHRWGVFDSSGAPEYFAGNVGIGIANPNSAYKLDVEGTIGAQEIVVSASALPDYVFEPGYRNAPLSEVARYIGENHHLPGMPSAAEASKSGLGVGEMQQKLLEKVEELTLHMIAADTENRELKARIAKLEAGAAH